MSSTAVPELLSRLLQQHLKNWGIALDQRVGVAYSGGRDSLALLMAVQAHFPGQTLALYLDHGLRPDRERAAERQVVQQVTYALGVSLVAGCLEPGALAKARDSLENAARRARYAWFEAQAREQGLTVIFTGHHGGDQAETVLMRFLAGRSLQGLGGIPPVRGLFHRPWLQAPAQTVQHWAETCGLPFVTDSTNADTSLRRNFLRQEILPVLKRVYPNWEESLVQGARSTAEVLKSWPGTRLWGPVVSGGLARERSAAVGPIEGLAGEARVQALLAGLRRLTSSGLRHRALEAWAHGPLAPATGLLLQAGRLSLRRQGDRLVWRLEGAVKTGEWLRPVDIRRSEVVLDLSGPADQPSLRFSVALAGPCQAVKAADWFLLAPPGLVKELKSRWSVPAETLKAVPVLTDSDGIAVIFGPAAGFPLWIRPNTDKDGLKKIDFTVNFMARSDQ